jgi:type II secretory pathway pseudopilin PulG
MIEALVCLAIIGVLAALALAAIQRSRSAALLVACAHHLENPKRQ